MKALSNDDERYAQPEQRSTARESLPVEELRQFNGLGKITAPQVKAQAFVARGGASLKTVAAHLNFAWSSGQDWMTTYLGYQRWLSSVDIEAFSCVCHYQVDDVQVLGLVWRWLVENAPMSEGGSS